MPSLWSTWSAPPAWRVGGGKGEWPGKARTAAGRRKGGVIPRITRRYLTGGRGRRTERVTLPRATCVTTLDAAPPGQHDTRMRPTARAGGRPSALPTRKPHVGMMVYCSAMPVSTGAVSTPHHQRMSELLGDGRVNLQTLAWDAGWW
jgi:hypothetical protein